MTVVAEAGSVDEAVERALVHAPDVIVMDVRLADHGSGIEATRRIIARSPGVRVLMLTSFPDDATVVDSMSAGALGFVLKELRTDEIVRAVEAVARGENLFEGMDTEESLDRVKKGKHLTNEKLGLLSPQEERVLERLALGETNGEIARALDLAEKTVKNYVSNLLLKLNVRRRAEAAAYWARHTAPSG